MLMSFLVGCGARAVAPAPAPGAQRAVQSEGLNYLLFLPRDYLHEPKNWPLILYLHGKGERGDRVGELERLKASGLPKPVEQRADFPFIVLSPQCPSHTEWDGELDNLNALLTKILTTYAVDPHRLYLTGISMGGHGAWALASRYPERFAAGTCVLPSIRMQNTTRGQRRTITRNSMRGCSNTPGKITCCSCRDTTATSVCQSGLSRPTCRCCGKRSVSSARKPWRWPDHHNDMCCQIGKGV